MSLLWLALAAVPARIAVALPIQPVELPDCILSANRADHCASLSDPVDVAFRPLGSLGRHEARRLPRAGSGTGPPGWGRETGIVLASMAGATRSGPPRTEVTDALSRARAVLMRQPYELQTRLVIVPGAVRIGVPRSGAGPVRLSDLAFPVALVHRAMMHAAYRGRIARVDTWVGSVSLPAAGRQRLPVSALFPQPLPVRQPLYLFAPPQLQTMSSVAPSPVPLPPAGAGYAALLAALVAAGGGARALRNRARFWGK